MAHTIPNVIDTELPRTPTFHGKETASSTYKRGAPLIWASGKLAIAATNPRDICGFALQAATGTTDADVMAARAVPFGIVRLEMSLDKAGGLGTEALAQTHVGTAYGITVDASGIWYVDVDKVTAGTNTVVRVTRLIDPIGAKVGDTATDANSGQGKVEVELLSEACAGQTAAA